MQDEKNILKWLNGELTEGELQALRETKDFKILEPVIQHADHLTVPEFDVEKTLKDLKSRKKQRSLPALNRWMRIAAIGLLCLMVGGIIELFVNKSTQVTTGLAEQQTTLLPDASEVMLNAKSKISYQKDKWKENREVFLEGEAYFKVAKGETFTVRTGYGNVQVLGTQFNVRKREDLFEVSCYQGRVSVAISGKTFVLEPGRAVALIQGELQQTRTFIAAKPSWLQNSTEFEKVPLYIVLAELERQYDISIELKDKSLLEKKFSGNFVNDDLSKAMEVISYSVGMNYEIKNNKVVVLYGK